jgi:hypothetical protein
LKKSLESSMGKWVYDGDHDVSFWEWDEDIYKALIELDNEFPLVKVLK